MEENKEVNGADTGEEAKAEPQDLVAQATSAAERIEAANAKTEALVRRQEKIAIDNKLGGRTGQAPVVEKKEETPGDYTKKIMEGNGN